MFLHQSMWYEFQLGLEQHFLVPLEQELLLEFHKDLHLVRDRFLPELQYLEPLVGGYYWLQPHHLLQEWLCFWFPLD